MWKWILTGLFSIGVAANASAMTLNWTQPSDNAGGSGVSGIEVYRTTGASCTSTVVKTVVLAPTTTYSDTTNAANTQYSYQLKAVDAAGNKSLFSTCVTATSASTALYTIGSDSFGRADDLTGLGSAWVGGYTGKNVLNIVSGRVRSTVAGTESIEVFTPGAATMAKVQDCVNSLSASGTDMDCTFPQNVTAGNIVACDTIGRGTGSGTATVVLTDTASNTYSTPQYVADTGTPMRSAFVRAKNVTGGFSVVHSVWTPAVPIRAIVCHEINGGDTTSPDDGVSVTGYQPTGTTGTDAITSGAIVTTANGDYIFGATYSVGGNIITAGTGYSLDGQAGGSYPRSEFKIQSAAGSVAATFQTHCCTAPYSSGVMAFKAASATATPNNQWGQKTLSTFTPTVTYTGVSVRQSAPATNNGYLCQVSPLSSGATSAIILLGGATLTSSSTETWAAGDKVRCEVESTAISFYRSIYNTATGTYTDKRVLTTTDATYASGKIAILDKVASGAVSQSEADDVVMGGFQALPPPPPSITSCPATATTATLVWTGPPTSIRVEYPTGSVVEALSAFPSGVYTFSATILASLANATTPAISFYAIDGSGIENTAGGCTATVPAPVDNTAPVVTLAFPTGDLPAGQTTSPVIISTNEIATCRYDITNVAYSLMTFDLVRTSLSYTFTASGLTNGSTNHWYAACQDALLNTSATVDLVITVAASTADTTAPTAPTNLACTALSQSQATCTAGASTDAGGIQNYQMYLSTDSGTTYLSAGTWAASPFTPVALPPGTLFSAKAIAIDLSNNPSLDSNVVTFTTNVFIDIIPPSQMTGLTGTAYARSADLRWDNGTDNGTVAFYVIEQSPAGCASWSQISPGQLSLTQLEPALTPSTAYCFRGKVVDGAGNLSSTYSDVLQLTTAASVEGVLDRPRQLPLQPRALRTP